ncbi:adenylosuccinate lyase [Candidatus Parcubacteria bacterium]|nr:adenylosuccinate lyase [Candidatus Parcubacteria bacterium]
MISATSAFRIYKSPLTSRYTGAAMQELFGDQRKFTTWRILWYKMAFCQHRLGVSRVTMPQVEELERHVNITDEEIRAAMALEKTLKHDVVAHSQTYGVACPLAAPIIHLACTSMFVCDNTDLIIMRDGLDLLITKLVRCIDRMAKQAEKWAHLPTLGWTHLQPAQPTTVGKRIAIWMQDLVMDLEDLVSVRDGMKFLGAKGATGTQDSYLKLFGGDDEKVLQLDRMITNKCGFTYTMSAVCGQTYTRKVDAKILSVLGGIGSSIHKMMQDLRLLQHMKEIEEPFDESQVGSSAMAYKRNPMRSERACGLARHSIMLPLEALMTHATQMFERTLDDSAPRRIYIPEAFLAADATLTIVQNVFERLVVYPKMIQRNLAEELPFMATEDIIDAVVKVGKNRAECHERLRVIAQESGRQVKEEGKDNPFIELIKADPYFEDVTEVVGQALKGANFIGRAPAQTRTFLNNEIRPVLNRYRDQLEGSSELRV